jgi:hypothetical protein
LTGAPAGADPPPGWRPAERLLFAALFFTYAFFHQGGGWNQNSRFAQARAITEAGALSINDFIRYRPVPGGAGRVERVAVGRVRELPRRGYPDLNTFDVSLHRGRLYPNKPPGATFLALPAAFAVLLVQRSLGVDVEQWAALNARAYLTTVFCAGLAGALAGVAFLRTSRRLFPSVRPRCHLGAALALALGTLLFPYGTAFYDHVPVAALLLGSFAVLVRLRREPDGRRDGPRAVWAGALAGFAVLTNYAAVLAGPALLFYCPRRWRLRFAAGAAPVAAGLAWYHAVCFGHPLAHAQSLSALPIPWTSPRWSVLFALLFSSYRGLFYSSPVLLLSGYGLWRLGARKESRPEALVIAWTFAAFLAMNAAFANWHGGACFGPRYLSPALPLLALPLAPAFARWPRLALALAAASVAAMLFATAVDPQVPRAAAHPFRDYLWPLATGKTVRSPVGEVLGPVSANPVGVYAAQTPFEARWNSFNLGEALFPARWTSLTLLVVVDGALLLAASARLRAGNDGPRDAPLARASAPKR